MKISSVAMIPFLLLGACASFQSPSPQQFGDIKMVNGNIATIAPSGSRLTGLSPKIYGSPDATFGIYPCPGGASGGLCATIILCRDGKCAQVPNMLLDTGSDQLVVRESAVRSILSDEDRKSIKLVDDEHFEMQYPSEDTPSYDSITQEDAEHLLFGGNDCTKSFCTVASGYPFRHSYMQIGNFGVETPVFVAKSVKVQHNFGAGQGIVGTMWEQPAYSDNDDVTYTGNDRSVPNGILGIGGGRNDIGEGRHDVSKEDVLYFGPQKLVYLHLNGQKEFGEILDKGLFERKYNLSALDVTNGDIDTGSDAGKTRTFIDKVFEALSPHDNPLKTHYFELSTVYGKHGKGGVVINQETGCTQSTHGQYKSLVVCSGEDNEASQHSTDSASFSPPHVPSHPF